MIHLILMLALLLSPLRGDRSVTDSQRYKNLYELSLSYVYTDTDEALEFASRAGVIAEEMQDPVYLARTGYLKGIIYYFRGELEAAGSSYQQAINLLQDIDNPSIYELKQSLWNNMGIIEDLRGNTAESLRAYYRSVDYAIKENDIYGEMQTLINIGLLEMKARDYASAQENLSKAESFFLEIDDAHHLGLVFQNFGVMNMFLQNYELSLEYLEKAISKFSVSGSSFNEREVNLDLLNLLTQMGNSERAKHQLSFMLEDYEPSVENTFDIPLFVQMARYEQLYGDLDTAAEYLLQSLEAINKNEVMFDERSIYLNLAEISASQGKMEDFLKYMESYREFSNNTHDFYTNRFLQYRSETERLRQERKLEARASRHAVEQHLTAYIPYIMGGGLLLVAFLISVLFYRKKKLHIPAAPLKTTAGRPSAEGEVSLNSKHPSSNLLVIHGTNRSEIAVAENKVDKRNGANYTYTNIDKQGSEQQNFHDYIDTPVDFINCTRKPKVQSAEQNKVSEKHSDKPAAQNKSQEERQFAINEDVEFDDEYEASEDSDKFDELFEKMKHEIETEQLYINANLSLSMLSHKLGTNDKYVSIAVNRKTGSSFNNFINTYRVKHAQKLLLKYGSKADSSRIVNSVGFGSVSSYHRVFKEVTGYSPGKWLKKETSKKSRVIRTKADSL